jgi:DNA primase
MAFPQPFLDEIRARVPLSQLVGRRVQLKQRARDDWWGLSPFASEKTASFHVRDDKGFFHCFSTGEHGDHFSWLMQVEGQSFPEAVEILAGMAGMEVPKASPEERRREEKRKDLGEVVAFAAVWYAEQLEASAGRAARDYLAGRGLEAQTVAAFQLGFAPDDRDALAAAAKAAGIDMPQLLEAGLYRKPDDGRAPYPLFRNRIMFPINDRRGRPIAFGGRFMGDAKAIGVGKYINSPETPLFDKSRTLYNLDRAREPARQGETLLVVEGYMDVIALWQAGFVAAVAPLGTAVTEAQIAELWRHADEPVLCLDGDVPGQKAAIRAAERALPGLQPGKSLRLAFLPAGEDPDSLVARASGVRDFRDLVGTARPLADFLFETEIVGLRLDTPERRAKLEADLFRLAGGIKDDMVRREYQRGFRDMLFDLHRKHSRAKLKTARRQAIREHRAGRRDEPRGPSAETPFGRQRLDSSARRLVRRRQEIVLAILVNHPTLIEEFDEILDLFVFDPDLDKLRAALQNLALAGHALDLEGLTHHLISSGADGPLHDVTTPAIYALAPQARPGADVSEARILLEHVLLIRQQDVLMGEYRTAGRDPDGVSDGDARDARLGALRRTVDDGEGRLAADLDWDDNG